MIAARRPDGGRAIRLLVGVRNYAEFGSLFDVAAADGFVLDLDDVPADIVEDDLFGYISDLLRTVPAYRHQGAIMGTFATEAARALVDRGRSSPFLLAGLYTQYIVAAYPDSQALDLAAAARLGATIPAYLPELIELDIEYRSASMPWLRPVLQALAHAHGPGMPLTVLARIAPMFSPQRRSPSARELRDVLATARVYIRQITDTDRSTAYHLAHQAFADHLRNTTRVSRDDVVTALLDPLGGAGNRDWGAAEPYVFRHILNEAASVGRAADILTDPGFYHHAGATEALRHDQTITARRTEAGSLAGTSTGLPNTWHRGWTTGRAVTSVAFIEGTTPTLVVADAAGAVSKVDQATGELSELPLPPDPPVLDLAQVVVMRIHLLAVTRTDGTRQLVYPSTGRIAPMAGWAGLPSMDQVLAYRRAVVARGLLFEIETLPDRVLAIQFPGINDLERITHWHNGPVTTAHCRTLLTGTPVAISSGADATIRMTNLENPADHQALALPAPATAVESTPSADLFAIVDGHLIAFRSEWPQRR